MRSLIIPLFFLGLPLAEIAAFVFVGREVGIGITLLLVLASTVAGAALLRIQGLGVLRRIRDASSLGTDPGRELVHGAMIVVAAILLILPGFITDIIGLLLFIPAVRDAGWRLVRNRLTIVTTRSAGGFRQGRPGHGTAGAAPRVIDLSDGEFSHTESRSPRDDQGRPE